jgi:adenylylsulfate kinase
MNCIYPFDTKITSGQRRIMMNQEPRLIWLTGLSGSGKTTLALRIEHYLFHQGYKAFLLDGDNVRMGLNKDLGFTEEDRKENLRRIGEVAKLMVDAGLVVICAFISPYKKERAAIKEIIGSGRFTEVFINCPLSICEERDVKGLYKKARQGIVPNFTGISAPYEVPAKPDVEVKTNEEAIETSVQKIIDHIMPLLEAAL